MMINIRDSERSGGKKNENLWESSSAKIVYNDGDSPNVTNESAPGCAEEHLIPHEVLLLYVYMCVQY